MKIPAETTRPGPLRSPSLDLWEAGRRGIWIALRDAAAAELISAEGPGWVPIDAQPGRAEQGDLLALVDAANVSGVPAPIRAPGQDVGGATRLIDAGAQGVVAGIFTGSPEPSAGPLARGYRFRPLGSDSSIISTAARGVCGGGHRGHRRELHRCVEPHGCLRTAHAFHSGR